MLIAIIGLVLLLLIVVGYSQRLQFFRYLPATSGENYSSSDEGLMTNEDTGKIFSGRLRTESDGRVEIYSYKDGLLNGQNVCYQDGRIKELGYWKNGEQHGHFKLYSDKGTLMDDAFFVDGNRHGTVKQYHHTTGKLKAEVNFVNGQMEGPCTEYSEAGTLTQQGNYKDNAMSGTWLYYYDNGDKKLEATFADGAAVADATYWTEDGAQVTGQLDSSGYFYPQETAPNEPELIIDENTFELP